MEGAGLSVQENEIKKDVLEYRDLLSERVIASDLLRESPSIRFHLGSRVVEKIERVEYTDGITAAADEFWSHMEKSTATGIWSSFYDHLINNGYLRILQIVDGYMTQDNFEVDEQQMTGLDNFQSPLSVKDLIGHLVQKRVLLPIHSEKILAKSDVPSEATKLMFNFLKRSKSIEWFELFLEVVELWDNKIADEIRELPESVKSMGTQKDLQFSQPHFTSLHASSTFENSENDEVDSLSSDALEVSCDEDDPTLSTPTLGKKLNTKAVKRQIPFQERKAKSRKNKRDKNGRAVIEAYCKWLVIYFDEMDERTFSHLKFKFDRIISKVELGQGIIPRQWSYSF